MYETVKIEESEVITGDVEIVLTFEPAPIGPV